MPLMDGPTKVLIEHQPWSTWFERATESLAAAVVPPLALVAIVALFVTAYMVDWKLREDDKLRASVWGDRE